MLGSLYYALMFNHRRSKMSDLFKERVFNSIEEINQRFGVEVELPERIPEGCNLLCYTIKGIYDIKYFHSYKEDDNLFHRAGENWIYSNTNLEEEIKEDISSKSNYIYLRLNKEEIEKEIFKLERLLGLETNNGFIDDLDNRDALLISKTWYHPNTLRYYISDDSDETVTFEEYLDIFYGD